MTIRIVIIGGGPAGYEAALLASKENAAITVVEPNGMGGACVLWDCVPSKTFIASTGIQTEIRKAHLLGINIPPRDIAVDFPKINKRVKYLALEQSADIKNILQSQGVKIIAGIAKLAKPIPAISGHRIQVDLLNGTSMELAADMILIATGASPRIIPNIKPDGKQILNWRQLYDLTTVPKHLIVIGSGVTGAEFSHAYTELGVKVTMISSRDRVLANHDADAALVIEKAFLERGITLIKTARAISAEKTSTGVKVLLSDGSEVVGSHVLITAGSVPNTKDIGLEQVGIAVDKAGYIPVDRVSRTTVPGIYAAGDCTGILPLASVAAMQGRIAIYHALGDGVKPLKLKTVASAIFTRPEVASVGYTQPEIDAGKYHTRILLLPLATNPRSKMSGLQRGFVKIFCRAATGVVIGGVIVAPNASELILPLAIAVRNRLTVDNIAQSFSVYPSLSGSITETARRLIQHDDLD